MPRWPAPPFALIAMMCGLVCSARGAQFPVVPTRAWGSRPGQKLIITWRKVFINDVNFDGPIHVPRSDIAQIIKEANQSDLDDHDPQVVAAIEIAWRGGLQDRGYYHAEVTAEAHSLGGNSNEERVQVTADVNEG